MVYEPFAMVFSETRFLHPGTFRSICLCSRVKEVGCKHRQPSPLYGAHIANHPATNSDAEKWAHNAAQTVMKPALVSHSSRVHDFIENYPVGRVICDA